MIWKLQNTSIRKLADLCYVDFYKNFSIISEYKKCNFSCCELNFEVDPDNWTLEGRSYGIIFCMIIFYKSQEYRKWVRNAEIIHRSLNRKLRWRRSRVIGQCLSFPQQYGINGNLIVKWKKQLIDQSSEVFASGKGLAPDREFELQSLQVKMIFYPKCSVVRPGTEKKHGLESTSVIKDTPLWIIGDTEAAVNYWGYRDQAVIIRYDRYPSRIKRSCDWLT